MTKHATPLTTTRSPVRRQKLQRLLARRKTAQLAIVRIVFGGLGRPEHHEFLTVRFNQRGELFAVMWRHMPRAAVRTIVVAHRRPLIGPSPLAAGAFVEIQKPGHGEPS